MEEEDIEAQNWDEQEFGGEEAERQRDKVWGKSRQSLHKIGGTRDEGIRARETRAQRDKVWRKRTQRLRTGKNE